MKDKLSTTEHSLEQFKVEAAEKEDELRRSLEEARNTSDLHINDYKRYVAINNGIFIYQINLTYMYVSSKVFIPALDVQGPSLLITIHAVS